MVEDGEEEKIKFLDDFKKQVKQIPELQKEIRSLKTRLGKLTGRVDVLENLELQKQIFSLNDKVVSFSEQFLTTNRTIARTDMDFIRIYMQQSLVLCSPTKPISEIREILDLKFARLSEALKYSLEPLNILAKFRKECIEISDKYGLNAFGI